MKKRISIYGPSTFYKLGHPEYIYETSVRLSGYYHVDLYATSNSNINKEKYSKSNINIIHLSGNNDPIDSPETKKEYLDRFGRFALIFYGFEKVLLSFVYLRRFFSSLDDCDHVYCMEFEYLSMFIMSFMYPKKIKKTVCVFHTADFNWVKGRSLVINLYKILARQVIPSIVKKSNGIAVHGEIIKRGLVDIVGDKYKEKVFISGYGFNYNNEECNSLSSRKKLDLPASGKIFLMFGLIRKDKGFPDILKNFTGENIGNSKVLLVGALQDVTKIEIDEIIKKYKLEDSIIFRDGFIEEEQVADYFCSCNYVFLSHQRHFISFSGPLALSMQYKKPVISSYNWQVSHIVEGNDLGYIYEDIPSLSKVLKKATRSEYDYNASAVSFYSWDSAALRIKNFFEAR